MTRFLILSLLLSITLQQVSAQCDQAFILDHMGVSVDDLAPVGGVTTPLTDQYIIPTVIHVFHDGATARISEAQAVSAIQVLNDDFNGLNDAWDEIDPLFDSIKATIDITFCLASIDPQGQPTTGVVYYDNPAAMRRDIDLYQFAWPNRKYFNIYLPQYVFDPGTNFTAFATLPSNTTINQNRDGVHYSSVRFGHGAESQLEEGDDWASVITHEVGHWLGLQHTFQGGCSSFNDGIDDTPPTTGGTIYLSGCNNEDGSCGQATNGSNFMDYNHRCKRMFTRGQVEVMLSVLNGIRQGMWSSDNLMTTGCSSLVSTDDIRPASLTNVYPNPSAGDIYINPPAEVIVYRIDGHLISSYPMSTNISISDPGVYMVITSRDGVTEQHKVVIW